MAARSSPQSDLRRHATAARAKASVWFFKTGPGEYSEGDRFLGVKVPDLRRVARNHRDLPLPGVARLLSSPWHEDRLLASIILVDKYRRADAVARNQVARFYLAHLRGINNWDIVDTSAPHVLGPHFERRSRAPLHRLAGSPDLWRRRVAVLSTQHFIRNGDFADTLRMCERLLGDPHDLMHKACGWMLREIGDRDRPVLEAFLNRHGARMPRTMLRYAIEKLAPEKRKRYLARPPKEPTPKAKP